MGSAETGVGEGKLPRRTGVVRRGRTRLRLCREVGWGEMPGLRPPWLLLQAEAASDPMRAWMRDLGGKAGVRGAVV